MRGSCCVKNPAHGAPGAETEYGFSTGTSTMILKWKKSKKADRKKILVVDDDPIFVRTITHRLEMNEYDVVAAADGEEAIDIALRERPDMILLDIFMPRLDGHDVLDRLRGMDQTRHIPVIMTTGLSNREDVERASSSGATDYLVKPFDPMELMDKIEKALSCRKES